MFKELPILMRFLKRGIVDTLFIDEDCIPTVLREYKRVNMDNAGFLEESIKLQYPNNYSSGYLYQKTNITKDE